MSEFQSGDLVRRIGGNVERLPLGTEAVVDIISPNRDD